MLGEQPDRLQLRIEVVRSLGLRQAGEAAHHRGLGRQAQRRLGLLTIVRLDLNALVEDEHRRPDPHPGHEAQEHRGRADRLVIDDQDRRLRHTCREPLLVGFRARNEHMRVEVESVLLDLVGPPLLE